MKPTINELVIKLMGDQEEIYRDRSARYGDVAKKVGQIIKILRPNGIVLVDEDEITNFAIEVMIIGKLCRFVSEENNSDHLNDLSVYSTILAARIINENSE